MAKADGSVIIDTRMNTSGFQTGVANMKKGFDGLGSAIGKLAKVMVGVFAVKQLVQFGKEAIELGSDLSEVQNVVDVTFENLNGEINDFAKNAIEQFGLSETAAKQYTSTMGAMLKSMGFTTREAADMSMTMTGLAADMASFYNLNAEDAFYKIRAGISGETEPLKQLGINLSVANLEQYALTQGITKSYNAMTQQEQALLRYNYLLKVTADAQGDFARTSDSWANQTRILSENFKALKATIGQGLINIFTPVIKVINVLLSKLATVANAFKAFTELITGNKSTASSGVGAAVAEYQSAADGAEAYASATQDAADATKEAEKAQKGYLSGLDEVQRYEEPDKDSAIGGGAFDNLPGGADVDYGKLAEGETAVDKLSEKFLKLKEILSGIIQPFKDAWAKEGQPTLESIRNAFSDLSNLAKSVGTSIYDVWTNGTGTQTLSIILQIVQDIFDTVGNLASGFTEAWNKAGVGTSIVQSIFNIFNIILGTIKKITGATADWAAKLDFTPLLTSIDNLLKAIQPLAQNIGDGLAWFYEHVLLPLAGFTIEEVIPRFFDTLSIALETANNILEALKPLFQWFWDSILEPIAEWTGGVFLKIWDGINTALKKFSDWCKDNKSIIENIAVAIGSFMAAWGIVKLATTIYGIVTSLAVFIATGGLATAVTTALGAAISFLTSPITIAIAAITAIIAAGVLLYKNWDTVKAKAKEVWNAIKETISSAWSGVKNIFSGVGNFFSGVWSSIKNAFGNVAGWFKDKFSAAWKAVKDVFSSGGKVFSGIKDGILDGLKSIINSLISGINTVVAIPFNGLNSALDGLREVSIAGIEPFSWLPNIEVPQIPYLAKGAVIPPNAPFMAVLGDQRRGNNIEAPEDLLRRIVREETGGRQSRGGTYTFVGQINRRTLFEEIIEEAKLRQTISGRNPFEMA